MRPKTSHSTSSMRIAPTTAHLIATPVCASISHPFLSSMAIDAHSRVAPHAIVVTIVVIETVAICLSLPQHEAHTYYLLACRAYAVSRKEPGLGKVPVREVASELMEGSAPRPEEQWQ